MESAVFAVGFDVEFCIIRFSVWFYFGVIPAKYLLIQVESYIYKIILIITPNNTIIINYLV